MATKDSKRIFVTGASGYMGRALIPLLLERGHRVRALVRPGSENKIDARSEIFIGDALDGDSYQAKLPDCDTLIHLVGVPHSNPAKAKEFVSIDLKSAREAIRVAVLARLPHFIYLSVAQPAPVMKAYVSVRADCEKSLRDSGLNATILRPWYVLGPGHRWPIMLQPVYRAAELFPVLRDGALRLGLLTLNQMANALTATAEQPPSGIRILAVPEIRLIAAKL